MRSRSFATISFSRASVALAAAVVAGCATQVREAAPPGVPPPQLQFLSSGPLELSSGCEFRSGFVYRTSYVVQGDGRVADVRPQRAPACLESALSQWVDSFRYVPPGEPVATVIDWMGVNGRRPR